MGLTIEQLRETSEYALLNEKQQRLIDHFGEHGDQVEAVRAVYGEGAVRQTGAIFNRHHIKRIIALLNGEQDKFEQFKGKLFQLMNDPNANPSHMAAATMIAKIEGWDVDGSQRAAAPNGLPTEKPSQDQIVIEDGRRYRVVAWDLGPADPVESAEAPEADVLEELAPEVAPVPEPVAIAEPANVAPVTSASPPPIETAGEVSRSQFTNFGDDFGDAKPKEPSDFEKLMAQTMKNLDEIGKQ
jgi:hypothetical protein